MAFGNAGKREAIFGLGHVHRGRDVVGEATVLVKVDDQQTKNLSVWIHFLENSDSRIIPVLGTAKRIVEMLHHLLARCHGTGRVH